MMKTIEFKFKPSDFDHIRKLAACETVADQFVLPEQPRVTCLIDDEDYAETKEKNPNTRGLFVRRWYADYDRLEDFIPAYFKHEVTAEYEGLIYLHGSTCSTNVGLTLTLAHELQHFVQFSQLRSTWAANVVMHQTNKLNELFKYWMFPDERDAKLVAKRVAETLYTPEIVAQYIQQRIQELKGSEERSEDKQEWVATLEIDTSIAYDLCGETKKLVEEHIEAIELTLHNEIFQADQDFSGLDLHSL